MAERLTLRQRGLKRIYPLLMKLKGKNKKLLLNERNVTPPHSFYSLQIVLNNGEIFSLNQLRGKKVLLVNTASNCGFTAQYTDLQKLYEQYQDKLAIIGFPANDFKEQENGSDEEIGQFCKINFGVTFPLSKKTSVVKNRNQHEVYQWLTHHTKNGWNDQQPGWNFCKYLVNEAGVLTHYFDTSAAPLDQQITNAILKK